ncbi:MAG: DMT family transporter, partial [Microcoleus sp.]
MSNKLELPEINIEGKSESLKSNKLNDGGWKTFNKTRIISAIPDGVISGDLANSKGNFWAVISLLAALLAVSFAAIFIRFSEQEISPNATVFNRLWIATVVFGMWNGVGTA